MKRVISSRVDSPHFAAENCQCLVISSKVIQGAIWALALASCAPTCPPPKVLTQVVKEPVAVACIDPASVGTEPGKIQLSADARIAADQAAGQAITLRAYIHELLALIQPCTRNPK